MTINWLLHSRIWAGFLAFGICAAFGFRLLYRGLRGDVPESFGTSQAGRGWFIAGGILCLLAFVGYTLFVWKQGYFDYGAGP